jgi:three-Cys-motif partner protein
MGTPPSEIAQSADEKDFKMPKREPLDLHEVDNKSCRRCKNKQERSTSNGLCDDVQSALDGAPVRCVGQWAFDKIYFLNQYFGIFGNGMKYKWDGKLDYIEVCSGPGRCVVRETGREIDGTALTVINNAFYAHYNSATFFDISQPVVDTLNARLRNRNAHTRAQAMIADYKASQTIARTAKRRSAGGLSLVFIDPTDCGVPFETLRQFKRELGTVDFIISIMTFADANRHLPRAIQDPASEVRAKYESFLGGPAFFLDPQNQAHARANDCQALRTAFREAYKTSLREEGYEFFAMEPVGSLYELLFASCHERGIRFWEQAQRIKPDNQTTFDFGI